MNQSANNSRRPELDVAGILSRSKGMLRNLAQANMDSSQLSTKPLAMTLLAVGLTMTVAGILYRTQFLGAQAGIRISYSVMALSTGVIVSMMAAYLLSPGRRLTTGVKAIITLICVALYFVALYLNGIMPAVFLPIIVITLHLLWPPHVALAMTVSISAVSAPFMLQDTAGSPAISSRILICAAIIILMMQVVSRQIINSYRKSLQVSEQLTDLVASLDGQLGQSRSDLITALRTDAESGLLNTIGFDDEADRLLSGAQGRERHILLWIKLKNLEQSKSILTDIERKAFQKILSERFKRIAGSDGLIGRNSRSDFFVLMKFMTVIGRDDGTRLDHILQNLRQPVQLRDRTIPCHPFIGASIWPTDGGSAMELRRQAEIAAETAMASEARHVLHYHASMHSSIENRLKIISGIAAAIKQDQFELEYQPVFDLGFESFHKVEALIRWNHPELGRVSPNRFIPLLDSEQLVEVTAWVLNTVKAQMKQWHAQTGMRLDVAVNIPSVYLQDRIAKQEFFFRRLDAFDRNTGNLIFEITESSLFEAGDEALAFLAEVRRRGFQIALDDFGTGFSNLRQLETLPLDVLKIDKSLIDEIDVSERKMALCGYIIRLGHELGLKIVAEGIETEKQRDALIWAGCNYGQGYLFSRPLPAGRIPDFFDATRKAIA